MTLLTKATLGFQNLEQIAQGDSKIHKLNPLTKTIATFIYVVIVVSYDRYQISSMLPLFFYPVIVMQLAEIPLKPLLLRLIISYPFCIFAGIANVFFDKETALNIFSFEISYGFISFVSIILKVSLTVMAVLILIATTTMPMLSRQLIRLKVPAIFVLIVNMIYRYISVALEETVNMYTAYSLRAPNSKGIKMRDIGSFMGQLLLRSFDRGERVYFAMKCRGFKGTYKYIPTPKLKNIEWVGIMVFLFVMIFIRFVNVSSIIGSLL